MTKRHQVDRAMQDLVPTAALALYPLLAVLLFAKLPFNKAVLWTVLIAQLLLPVGIGIKFDQIPQFDKLSIPSLCLLAAMVLTGRLAWKTHGRGPGIAELFAAMFLLGPILTSEFNGEDLRYGPLLIPGVGLYDAGSNFIASVIALTPYFVGRFCLRDNADIAEILRVLLLGMLVYSIPLLIEVRLSPQFHYWVYGSQPSMFAQSVRDGGFRPMVFLGHGLVAAHFVLIALFAAAICWRLKWTVVRVAIRQTSNYRIVTGYLAVVLIFCRTLGANLFAIALSPLILFGSAKVQMRVALLLVSLSLLYPTMRYFDLIPTESLVAATNTLSPDRGQSLGFRFYNEDLLLHHAVAKPYFGWGRFGRNRVYDPDDGNDMTLTDGEWIITLGQFGAIGFIAEFGLLCLAVFRAAFALRYAASDEERRLLSGLALITAASIFDLLPNAFLVPWTWLLAGALLGRAEALLARRSMAAKDRKTIDPAPLAA